MGDNIEEDREQLVSISCFDLKWLNYIVLDIILYHPVIPNIPRLNTMSLCNITIPDLILNQKFLQIIFFKSWYFN